jgi:hypothetical protein
MAMMSAAKATGWAWKLPPEMRILVGEEDRIVGHRIGLDLSVRAALVSRSRQAPITCGWQRKL